MPTRIVPAFPRQNRASMVARRRQQQRRAGGRINHRLDHWVKDRASASLARQFHLEKIGHAQARNIDRGRVVTVCLVVAVRAIQPPSPLHGFGAIMGRAIGVGALAAAWTSMTGAARVFCMETQTDETALVSEQFPDFPSNGRVVSIIAPPSPHAFSTPGGLERLEGR